MIWPLLLFFNSYPFCCTVIFILLPLLLTFPLPLTISLSILCSSTSLTNYAYLVTSSYVNGFSKCLLNFTSIGRSLIFVYIPVHTSSLEYTLNYPSLVNIIYVGWLFENYSMIDPMMTSYLKLYAGCLHNGHSQRGLALVEVRIKKLFRSKHWKWLQNIPLTGVFILSIVSVHIMGIFNTSHVISSASPILKHLSNIALD